MPFFDDSGPQAEDSRGPIWSSFFILSGQLERFIALNVVWAVQLLPLIFAFIWEEAPLWLRLLLIIYSGTAFFPFSGLLYRMVANACESRWMLAVEAKETFMEYLKPSFFVLFPLFGILGGLINFALLARSAQLLILEVTLEVLVLLLLTTAIFWGPIVAYEPEKNAWQVLRQAARLVWRSPAITFASGLVMFLALLLGTISIGGIMLVCPVFIAIVQTQLYRHLTKRADVYA